MIIIILFITLFLFLGETGNMGASSGGSGAGTPERNNRSQASSTPDHPSSSHDGPDGPIHGAGMMSDSLLNSVLPASHSKVLPPISDRWQQRGR